MNEELKTFGANLLKHMNARQISAAVLAEKADVSVKTINNIVQGRHATQIDKLAKLCGALDVQFWTMWLPGLTVDPKTDRIIEGLLETSVHLSADALVRIARMAELELNSERSSAKPKKSSSAGAENHQKR
jgi:transcriptional regulator with XRE-family HTH domain